MYYVYYEHVETGKQEYIGQYNTMKEAVSKVSSCYAIDARTFQKGEYYYFIKKR